MITEHSNDNISNLTIDDIVKLRNLPNNYDDVIDFINNNFNSIDKLNLSFDSASFILDRVINNNIGFGSNFDKKIKFILMCNDKEKLLELFNLYDVDMISRIKDPNVFNSFINTFDDIDKELIINKRKKYIQDTVSEYLDFMMYALDEENEICSSIYKDNKNYVLDFISQYFNNSLYSNTCIDISNIINNNELGFNELEFYRDYLNLKNNDLMGIANFFKTNESFTFPNNSINIKRQF